jgi:hypothetical protein
MSGLVEIQRLINSRCALTVQAASKSGTNDGALVVVFQVETTCSPSDAAALAGEEQKSSRLVECELSPAQLFSLLAVLEEAHAKLLVKSSDDS